MTLRFLLLMAACISIRVQSALAAPAPPNPMALLPATSRHTFLPAPRGGVTKVEYLHLQDNKAAFIVLQAPDKPNLQTDWKEVSYFDKAGEDRDDPRKMLRFQPDGRLALEIDKGSNGTFIRHFYHDGALASYEYWNGHKRMAGFSIRPSDRSITSFSGGKGDFIEWSDTKGNYEHDWINDGNIYLAKTYKANALAETRLVLPQGGEFWVTQSAEKLNLFSQHEYWGKKPGQPVTAQVMDSYINGKDGSFGKFNFTDDEIKKHIRQTLPRPSRRPLSSPSPELLQQLEADYLARRTEFLADYKAVLRDAGQTYQSLHLENVLTPPK